MSSAKITLLGFSRWMKDNSDDLFKAFDDLPAGIDKDVLINNILLRGGEFEVIYSDPYFMQESIYTWLAKWRRTLEKWLAALAATYDPLNNYDRHEEYTDTEGIGDTETRSGTRTDSRSRDTSGNTTGSTSGSASNASSAATNTTGTDSGSQETENKVSAFDASTYQAKDRSDTTTGSTTSSSTGTTSANSATSLETRSENRSDNASESGSESTADTRAASRNRLLQHTAHLFGNIGVTTSQEMLQAELSSAEWNLYDHITDLFLTEYIIPVYV